MLGDAKKLSVSQTSGTFVASDALRPPSLTTFDMRENLQRTIAFLNGQTEFFRAQIAAAKTKPKETAEPQALANFCHALLSANEFLYVD